MDPARVDVTIFSGGLGTRLGGQARKIPKALVDVHGKPFLEIVLDQLARQGLRRFILCTGYLGEQIRSHFSAYGGGEVFFSQEARPLGTAGALELADTLLKSERILVANGDSFAPSLDAGSLIQFHEGVGAQATVAVIEADSRRDGGYVTVDENRRVMRFSEKEYRAPCYISAGVYVFEREILDRIPAGRFLSLEKDLLPSLPAGVFYGYPCAGSLHDIGTPERLEAFRHYWRENKVIGIGN